ncbi:hypothetical protein [Microbacterium sp.]|uniref:hypothetical protein n=1 Tax=Microbacterium sp. TaxID=51671 RepID=UPI00257A8B66|nr:hypothetical protein [Microbacterium sp.]
MVLFHLGVLDSPPRTGGPIPYEERLAEVSAPLPAELVGYLEGSAEGLVESLTA